MAGFLPETFSSSPTKEEELSSHFIGTSLKDAPVPSAIVDISKAKRNCAAMLKAVESLDVSFRAHVKTHKTSELTKLQVGETCKNVRLIVSTIIEAEQLVPLLKDYKMAGAKVNVLYGVPIAPSQVERLARVGKALGQGSISVMADHVGQLPSMRRFKDLAGFPVHVFIKVDSGSHRAGLSPTSDSLARLVKSLSECEDAGDLLVNGLYSHAGHSYYGNSPEDAMAMLKHEISACEDAAKHASVDGFRKKPLVVSVGASPTVMSAQNLQDSHSDAGASRALANAIKLDKESFELELHAGVYPLLDMQQVSVKARHIEGDPLDHIALTILAEVCSLYPERERPEALISAGCLALGREPCKDYKGWGIVTPWGMEKEAKQDDELLVTNISQEHGIIGFEKSTTDDEPPLSIGQKIRIWPNHACIASASYGWYLVVDSSSDSPDRIVDVWGRWRGW